MTSIINKILITTAIVMAIFAFVSFSQTFEIGLVDTVEAAGSCGSCGGEDPDTGGGGGGEDPDPPVAPTCNLTLDVTEVDNIGDAYRVEWSGGPASASFFINGSAVSDSGHANFTFTGPNYDRFHLVGNNGGATCEAEVRVVRRVIEAPTCDSFTATPGTLPFGGGTVTLDWATTHATNADIDGQAVAGSGTWDVAVAADHTFTLNLSNSEGSDSCTASVVLEEVSVPGCTDPAADNYNPNATTDDGSCTYINPVLTCDAFNIAQAQVVPGSTLSLTWNTSNATSASIDQGIGAVAVDGTKSVIAPTVDGTYTYTLTATDGTDSVTCNDSVIVDTPNTTAPAIDIIKRDASDQDDVQTVAIGGTANFEIVVTNTGNEALVNVVVTDPLEANCNTTIGNLAIGASHTYTCSSTNVQNNFTNIANVTGNSAVDNAVVNDTDPTDVNVSDPAVFSCAANVNFSGSPTSLPRGGGSVNFSWTVSDADSVSIAGLTSTSHSGSESVNVTASKTFTLTATKAGFTTLSCPVTVSVATGGGGGGSSKPRCDLDISDSKINKGQEITLTWDTSRARDVILTDNHGNTLLETDDKDDFDGKMTIKPAKDTTYTLIAKRGSRERECEVEVDVKNSVTVLETRSQDPRVAGISLTQVPYTGFEAGPALTMIFYFILAIWGLFVAYIFVIRRDSMGGVSLAGAHDHVSFTDASVDASSILDESIAEEYVDTVVASATAPADLPTSNEFETVVGYNTYVEKKTMMN